MHKKRIRDTTYYYTSVRENGKVKTIYLGRNKKDANRREEELKGAGIKPSSHSVVSKRLLVFVFLALVVIGGVFLFRGVIVGYFIVEMPSEENMTVELTFQSQDFLPKDAVIEVSIQNQTSILTLEEFLEKSGSELQPQTGSFYSEGTGLSGSGEGYGVEGEKVSYPDVSFRFNLSFYGLVITQTPYNVTNTTTVLVNGTLQIFNETLNMTVNETVLVNKTIEENITLYNTTEQLVLLGYEIINSTCNFNEPYSANLGDLTEQENATNYSVALVPGSVRSDNETLNDSYVSLSLVNGTIRAETNYFEYEKGYGEGFIGEEKTITLDLSETGIEIPGEPGNYTLKLRIVYNESVLRETSRNITVFEKVLADSDWDGDPDTTDCQPDNPDIHHGTVEVCNNQDDDCDELIDEGFDSDGDGYTMCSEPTPDCDDAKPEINPGAPEICDDEIDNDCDGLIDEEDHECEIYENNTIYGGSGTTCEANNTCFMIKDIEGAVKARFDNNGYVDVKGSYSSGQSSLTPPANSFIIKNSTGTVVTYIDSSGNLAILGYFYQDKNPTPSGNDDFIIKDSGGNVVGYIDGVTGNLYFKGQLHYSSNF